jgi:hypothetical protein
LDKNSPHRQFKKLTIAYKNITGGVNMSKLEIFDPPMCCKTGICGEHPDFTLVTFASDLEWLKAQGVEVERHCLSLEPNEFNQNEAVKNLIDKDGSKCLPVLTLNNQIVFKGEYISREKLANICKVQYNSDDAPPIHREENCCCGLDCDCTLPKSEEDSLE